MTARTVNKKIDRVVEKLTLKGVIAKGQAYLKGRVKCVVLRFRVYSQKISPVSSMTGKGSEDC